MGPGRVAASGGMALDPDPHPLARRLLFGFHFRYGGPTRKGLPACSSASSALLLGTRVGLARVAAGAAPGSCCERRWPSRAERTVQGHDTAWHAQPALDVCGSKIHFFPKSIFSNTVFLFLFENLIFIFTKLIFWFVAGAVRKKLGKSLFSSVHPRAKKGGGVRRQIGYDVARSA